MRFESAARALCILAVVTLAGCGTTPVAINYKAPATAQQFTGASAATSAGRFSDDRGEPPKWLGAIRGGFGNPLKVLEVEEPVAQMVQTAFSEGLRARGAAKDNAKYELVGTIKKLDCSQYVRREAHGVIEVTVVQVAGGKQLFKKSYTADLVDGSMVSLATGVFASTDDLRKVLERALQQIVDQALDDPQLRAALR